MSAVRVALLASSDPESTLGLARAWTAAGDRVTVVLLDDAVAAARTTSAAAAAVAKAVTDGVAVTAHDDALHRRGLDAGHLAEGVKVATLDEVADLVGEGCDKAVWL